MPWRSVLQHYINRVWDKVKQKNGVPYRNEWHLKEPNPKIVCYENFTKIIFLFPELIPTLLNIHGVDSALTFLTGVSEEMANLICD